MSDSGFFKKFHETINQNIDDVTKNNFANLECNSKRVAYLCSLPVIKDYDVTGDIEKCQTGGEFPVKKDLEKARQLKDEGNKAVLKGDWNKALQLYSQSMVFIPAKEMVLNRWSADHYLEAFQVIRVHITNKQRNHLDATADICLVLSITESRIKLVKTEELSILLANRSAALNHLEQYEDTLADIQRCLSLGYPRHLRYKVYERKARTLLVLKRNKEAIASFQNTISALDEASKLDKDKRQKIRTDAKLMLEILNKGLVLAGNPKDPEPLKKTPPKPKLPGKHNPHYPAASESIKIDQDEVRGRFAVATKNIAAGDIILVEKPHSGVLLGEFSSTHCQHCFVKCPIPLPCPKCPNVIFCSDKCLEMAQKSYHGYECSILPLIWKSGCSITCHIALRMITQNNKEYFTNISKELEDKPNGPYKTDDYRNIFHLVAHEEKRSKQDFLHRTQMTSFLVKLLEICGYFDGKPRDKPMLLDEVKSMAVDDKYKEDVALIGGLILKNLQILQFNAHEVFELQCLKPKVGQNVIKHNGKSVFLAGAVFPTLALFNHSCDPSVVRYFCGPYVVVRAVKNIKAGEEVSENYGPIFTTVPKVKRQAQLKDQYWFDCNCEPCKDNWPTYREMNENYMRFKCDSDRPCPNVVAVPHDCKEFMVQCGLCQQYTNILKGLKSLQDTEMMYRLGRAAMEEGKYGEALKKYIEVLKLYDETLCPPYRSYYDCVQDLRSSMLATGNYSII